MAPRSKDMGHWALILDGMKKELRGQGAAVTARRRGAAEFVEWATKEKVLPNFDPTEVEHIVTNFSDTLTVHLRADGTLNKQGEACLVMARELLQKSMEATKTVVVEKVDAKWEDVVATIAEKKKPPKAPKPTAPEPAVTTAAPAPPPTEEPEEQMAKRQQEEQPEEEQFEEDGVQASGEDEDEPQEEPEDEPQEELQPPPRRQRPPPVVRYVERAPARGHKRAESAVGGGVRSAALKNLLPRPEKIRLYKRNEMGKRELIDDFTLEEIGDMKLEAFIREYVDPKFSNEEGDFTEYIAYPVDPRTNKDQLPPSSIQIRLQPQGPEAPNPMNQLRQAMGMVQELQQTVGGMQQQQQPAQNPLLQDAMRQKAAAGDMQGMFMLMMMERMQQPANNTGSMEQLLMKVLDRMDRMERGGGSGSPSRGNDFGPSFGPPPMPFGYPPMPMAAPPQDTGGSKLLDLAMARLAEKPPSLADSVKDLLALQTLMQPKSNDSSELAALREEIRRLAGGNVKPGSLEENLANFEKMTTMAKSISTQIGGGSDVGGFFKGLITPEVGKAIAGIVSQAQGKVVAPAAAQAAPPPQPQPPPRDFNRPPMPPPDSVKNAVAMFGIAQTPEVQAQRMVDVLMAMYLSNDPYYLKVLGPALEDLNKSDQSVEFLKGPRKLLTQMLMELKKDMARPEFVDAVLAALALRAEAPIPATLLSSQGKWFFNGTDVVMLENAKAVDTQQPVPVTTFTPPTGPMHPDVVAGVAPAVLSPPREEVVKLVEVVEPVKVEAAPAASPPINITTIEPLRETVPVETRS